MSQKVVKLKGPTPIPIEHATNLKDAVGILLKNGWCRLEYTTLSRQFDPVIEQFIKLTEDPKRERYLVEHPREIDDGEPYLGLMQSTKGELKKNPRRDEIAEGRLRHDETKFKFHANNRLLGHYGRSGLIREHQKFLLEVMRMHGEAMLLGQDVAEELDRQLPGYNFLERMLETEHMCLTRLLRYMCDGKSPGIATRHRDKDFLTIHTRSDRGGLWLADNRDMIIADAEETRANSVLIFFGRKAWEITRGRLKGIIHGVRDLTFDDMIGRMPRHTAVSFLHASVKADELAWADDHMNQLQIPPHIDRFGLAA